MLAKIAVRVDARPGRLAAPERRARREREQHRQLGQQALHDMHREVGIGHRDVHVHAEHELAPRDVLQLLDEPAVAVARRDALILGARERVGTCAGEPHAERLDGRGDAAPHASRDRCAARRRCGTRPMPPRACSASARDALGRRAARRRAPRRPRRSASRARRWSRRGACTPPPRPASAALPGRKRALLRSSSREYCPVGSRPQPILRA